MSRPSPKPNADSTGETRSPFAARWHQRLGHLRAFHLREVWWDFLTLWETRRWVRWTVGVVALLALTAGALRIWAYPAWVRHNAIAVARGWMEAGKWSHAAEAVHRATLLMPERPEPWQMAAELARLGGQKTLAVGYALRAARLAPEDPAYTLGWAQEALLANLPAEAARALATLPPEFAMTSAHALRLRGELARRNLRLDAALGYFEAASRVEGGGAINEVPLGLILLQSTDAALRQRGLTLLAKWTGDAEWGPAALRTLLDDALIADDRTALRRWGDALLAHPRRTIGDMPRALGALARADEARYHAVLADLERDHAITPAAAAQLLGWLTQIGRHADAVRWLQTLPTPALQTPPLAVLAAEALRATADWPALAARLEGQNWGTEFEFLRWAYALQAARALGQTQRAEELWSTLRHHTERNGPHALFSAGTLYSWGQTGEAETIWWQAAEQGGKIATDALGALARHYQTRRDADGQYRVFRQLHFLQPAEADLANNFAFFAALLDRESRLAESLARKNHAAEPANETYSATLAFVWLRQNRAREALALIEPLARAPQNPAAVHFAYGLALAQTGRKTEARPLLNALPESSLTLREVELIQSALAD